MCECAHCKAGGYTYSEEFRKACEDRYWKRLADEIMAMPSIEARRAKLAEYRKKYKPRVAERLEAIIKAEWARRKNGSNVPVQGA